MDQDLRTLRRLADEGGPLALDKYYQAKARAGKCEHPDNWNLLFPATELIKHSDGSASWIFKCLYCQLRWGIPTGFTAVIPRPVRDCPTLGDLLTTYQEAGCKVEIL